jgi:hypothetical protein
METYGWPWMEAQVEQTVELWHESAAASTRNARRYSHREQEEHEKAYDEALNAVEADLQWVPGSEAERLGTHERIVASFAQFSARALDLNGEAIELLTREFLPIGTDLARWARRFDPGLSMDSIVQASRNAWTACGLQPLLGARVTLSPSILGYSLLYPYSDNYLDDGEVPAEKKLRFSRRFRCRLLGEKLPAEDDRESAMWTLIVLIEMQYPRGRFPQVFDCLLAIHQAQERSIGQIHSRYPGDEGEVLRVSCGKGGSSVLADACLAHGSLGRQESEFAFQWGVLLQLGDDLQDVRDDMRRGSTTLFSRAAAAGKQLDELTVQLLNFGQSVGRRMEELPHGTPTLKNLLRISWGSLIIKAVADSHEFFSAGFLQEAERCSPFRFDFLRVRRDRLASRQGLYARLFGALMESRQDYKSELPAPDRRDCRSEPERQIQRGQISGFQ